MVVAVERARLCGGDVGHLAPQVSVECTRHMNGRRELRRAELPACRGVRRSRDVIYDATGPDTMQGFPTEVVPAPNTKLIGAQVQMMDQERLGGVGTPAFPTAVRQ